MKDTLRRSDDSTGKQALKWILQDTEARLRPKKFTWKETGKKKCDQQVGGRWRRQHKTEPDGDKWSVATGSK